jgi:hypothetical protein
VNVCSNHFPYFPAMAHNQNHMRGEETHELVLITTGNTGPIQDNQYISDDRISQHSLPVAQGETADDILTSANAENSVSPVDISHHEESLPHSSSDLTVLSGKLFFHSMSSFP